MRVSDHRIIKGDRRGGRERALTEDTHVLVREVETTVARYERGQLLAVLDQLHSHALTDSRVRLLRLDSAGLPGITREQRCTQVIDVVTNMIWTRTVNINQESIQLNEGSMLEIGEVE